MSTDDLDKLADVWRNIHRLVIDEFSMVGKVKVARASRNLEPLLLLGWTIAIPPAGAFP